MKTRELFPIVMVMCGASTALAQTAVVTKPTPIAATAPTAVPALVPYSAMAEGNDGRPITGEVSATFLLFKDESRGEPLWTETQLITLDATGHYTAQLGASSPSGLPLEIFGTGTARWLEVQIAGQKPQPRTLLMTVPYAAKAADAATLGGLPASAFALAGTTSNAAVTNAAAVSPDAGSTVTTAGGTSDYLPKFTGASTLANSQIYDNGTSVGIGDIPNPSAKLDINGGVIMRGGMTVSRTGNATASKGYPSYPFGFYSNAYNSSTKGTDNPHFLLQSEPTGNNTSNTGATFNLLYSNHGTAPVETGFSINPDGTLNFSPAQAFPGDLNITASNTSALGPDITLTNQAGGAGAEDAIDFNTSAPVYGPSYNPGARIMAQDDGFFSDDLLFFSNIPGSPDNGAQLNMEISSTGDVTIGGYVPQNHGEFKLLVTTPEIVDTGITAILADPQGGSSGDGGNGIDSYGEDSNGGPSYSPGSGGLFVGGLGEGTSPGGDGLVAAAGESLNSNEGYAGYFDGNVEITGTLNGSTPQVRIDSPRDPANQYLSHAAVASSEMMNLYTGNVTTDELGLATVTLPEWFSSYNTDFRYQLTVVGQFAQAVVKDKIADGKFRIMTNAPHVEVSWLVTALRQDAYAKAHPLVVETPKPANERGYYLHPELFGQPKEKGTLWGRHPEDMRRAEARRQQIEAARANGVKPTIKPASSTRNLLPSKVAELK